MSREAEAPLPAEQFEEFLRREASGFRLALADQTFDGLAAYLSDLDLWRRTTNLTGDLPASDLVTHALESVLGTTLIAQGERVVDVGSGAGFPAVPLAIARPDLSVTLVEPRLKRAAFLRHVVRALPLPNVAVLEARVEQTGAGSFGVAMTRAVGRVSEWLPDSLIRPGGSLLAWTTQASELEAELSPGFRLEHSLEIPGTHSRRIALYRRV